MRAVTHLRNPFLILHISFSLKISFFFQSKSVCFNILFTILNDQWIIKVDRIYYIKRVFWFRVPLKYLFLIFFERKRKAFLYHLLHTYIFTFEEYSIFSRNISVNTIFSHATNQMYVSYIGHKAETQKPSIRKYLIDSLDKITNKILKSGILNQDNPLIQ